MCFSIHVGICTSVLMYILEFIKYPFPREHADKQEAVCFSGSCCKIQGAVMTRSVSVELSAVTAAVFSFVVIQQDVISFFQTDTDNNCTQLI